MSKRALDRLKDAFDDAVLSTHDFRGDETALVERERIAEIATWLRDDPELRFDMLTDLTAVDLLPEEPRFQVVYHFYSTSKKHRLRLKIGVPEEEPAVDTLCRVYPIADWLEREVWDMYGLRFRGHPDMRRILLYEEFEGHPLRKDYPKDKRQPLSRRPEHEIAQVLARRGKGRSLTQEKR